MTPDKQNGPTPQQARPDASATTTVDSTKVPRRGPGRRRTATKLTLDEVFAQDKAYFVLRPGAKTFVRPLAPAEADLICEAGAVPHECPYDIPGWTTVVTQYAPGLRHRKFVPPLIVGAPVERHASE